MFGENILQPEVEGLENDFMETMSHLKLDLSFPLAKKIKDEKKMCWTSAVPKPTASFCLIFRKIVPIAW